MLPLSQTSILKWVAWLGSVMRLQPKTIKSYIAHLWSAHMDTNIPFSVCESPLLKQVICGIKRYMGQREHNPKLPITCGMLKKLLEAATHLSILGHLSLLRVSQMLGVHHTTQ